MTGPSEQRVTLHDLLPTSGEELLTIAFSYLAGDQAGIPLGRHARGRLGQSDRGGRRKSDTYRAAMWAKRSWFDEQVLRIRENPWDLPASLRTMVAKSGGGQRPIDDPAECKRLVVLFVILQVADLVDDHLHPGQLGGRSQEHMEQQGLLHCARRGATPQDHLAWRGQELMREGYDVVVTADLADAFGLLPALHTKQTLMGDLCFARGAARWLWRLVQLDAWDRQNNEAVRNGRLGVEQGNALSAMVMNLALAGLFRLVEARLDVHVLSYLDDIYIFARSEGAARHAFEAFKVEAVTRGFTNVRDLHTDDQKCSRIIDTRRCDLPVLKTYLVRHNLIRLAPDRLVWTWERLRSWGAKAGDRVKLADFHRAAQAVATSHRWLRQSGALMPQPQGPDGKRGAQRLYAGDLLHRRLLEVDNAAEQLGSSPDQLLDHSSLADHGVEPSQRGPAPRGHRDHHVPPREVLGPNVEQEQHGAEQEQGPSGASAGLPLRSQITSSEDDEAHPLSNGQNGVVARVTHEASANDMIHPHEATKTVTPRGNVTPAHDQFMDGNAFPIDMAEDATAIAVVPVAVHPPEAPVGAQRRGRTPASERVPHREPADDAVADACSPEGDTEGASELGPGTLVRKPFPSVRDRRLVELISAGRPLRFGNHWKNSEVDLVGLAELDLPRRRVKPVVNALLAAARTAHEVSVRVSPAEAWTGCSDLLGGMHDTVYQRVWDHPHDDGSVSLRLRRRKPVSSRRRRRIAAPHASVVVHAVGGFEPGPQRRIRVRLDRGAGIRGELVQVDSPVRSVARLEALASIVAAEGRVAVGDLLPEVASLVLPLDESGTHARPVHVGWNRAAAKLRTDRRWCWAAPGHWLLARERLSGGR